MITVWIIYYNNIKILSIFKYLWYFYMSNVMYNVLTILWFIKIKNLEIDCIKFQFTRGFE